MSLQPQLDGAESQGPGGQGRVVVKVPGGGECPLLALDGTTGVS